MPKISIRISGTDAERQLNRGEGFVRPPQADKCNSLGRVGSRKVWIDFKRGVVFSQCLLRMSNRISNLKNASLDQVSVRASRPFGKGSVDEIGRLLLVFKRGHRPSVVHIIG
jgi:hypothetical protein